MSYFEAIDYSTEEFSRFYDELSLWSAPFGLLLLAHIPLQPGARIVDVGAGTGFLAVELAQRCGASSEVVAVDPWGAALRRLADRTAFLGLENIRSLEAPLESAALPAAHFDLVVSNLGINNFSDPGAALAACHRALRPGGELWLSTNTRGHMAEFYAVYGSVLEELGSPEALPALEKHIDHRASEESMAALLRDAGFTIGKVVHDRFRMRYADGSAFLRHFFIRLAFLPDWAAVCPQDRRDEVFERLEARLNALAAKNGELALSVPMLCVQASKAR